MPRRVFRLRSLSAALVVSTSLTAPAFAVDVTVPAGPLTGPQNYGAVDVFSSAADVTSAGKGFVFSGAVGTATNAGSVNADRGGFEFGAAVGGFTNRGNVRSSIYISIWFDGPVGWVKNAGNVYSTGPGAAYGFGEAVESFANSGSITADGNTGAYFYRNVASFTNSGSIISNWDRAVYFSQDITLFTNEVGGSLRGQQRGLQVGGATGTFTNAGTIRGVTDQGVEFTGAVTSFENSATGVIEGVTRGAQFSSAGTITNAGTISGDLGVYVTGAVDRFTNESTGVIEGENSAAVFMRGNVGAFTNGGTITSEHDEGVRLNGAVGTFTNYGTISSLDDIGVYLSDTGTGAFFVNERGATIRGSGSTGVYIFGSAASIINNGTIVSDTDYALWLRNNGGRARVENGGTITGRVGLVSDDGAATVVNSGTIQGTGGRAIQFGAADESLIMLTGSRILGSVEFAAGNDTLDVAGYRGSTMLTVANLETVVAGNALINDQRDGSGDGTLSIVDGTVIRSGGSTVMGEVAGAIGGEIAGALGGQAGSFTPTEPMGYAPSRPVGAAEAAADELGATAEPTAPEVWGKVFGGIANKTNDYNAVLGGIIAGSHVAVDANTRLGGVVSVSGSRFVTVGGGQTVTGTIGAAGLYGSTDLGGVVVSYSVLGGVAANHSDRTVTAMVTETARADFGSWFWSPELGLSMPVPLFEGVETDAGFKLRYVGGGVGSYTETGSSQNLSVGTAAVNLLDARVELTSKTQVASNDFGDVMLYGTAGLLAQQNFGGSVAIAGFPIAQTPASFAYGAYADLTLEGPIGPSAKASASTGLELRSDGLSSASANLGLSSTF